MVFNLYRWLVFLFILILFLPVHQGWTGELQEKPSAQSEKDESLKKFLEMDIEELMEVSIVVAATKTEQVQSEAPSIIHVVTTREIRQRGYRTVGEALQSCVGLAVIDDLVNYNVGVRGLFAAAGSASDIVKVMINGQSIAFRPTSGNVFLHELIPIVVVKRIEIIIGPASALYGANAFLGVINIVTKTGQDYFLPVNSNLSLDGYYLHNDDNRSVNGGGEFALTGNLGKFSYLLSGVFNYSDRSGLLVPGYQDIIREQEQSENPSSSDSANGYPSPGWDPSTRIILLRSPYSRQDLERVGSFYSISSYDFGKNGEISVDGSFQYFDRFGEFQDISQLTHNNRAAYFNWFGRLSYRLPKTDFGLGLNVWVAISGGQTTPNDRVVDHYNPNLEHRRNMGYFSIDSILELDYTLGEKNIFKIGADITLDFQNLLSISTFNMTTGELTNTDEGFGKKDFTNHGYYAQWLAGPFAGFSFTLGARLDSNNIIACDSKQWDCLGKRSDQTTQTQVTEQEIAVTDRGSYQLSSRAALVYTAPVGGIYTKLIYGSSYKAPSPYQLYHNPITNNGNRGEPFLKPQTADTVELAIGDKPNKYVHFVADGFYTSVSNIVSSFKSIEGYENRNAVAKLSGVEATINFHFKKWVSGYANFTYLFLSRFTPQRKPEESILAWQTSPYNNTVPTGRFPDYSFNLGLNFRLTKLFLNINLDAHYVGPSRASMINNQLYNPSSLSRTYILNGYFLGNMTISSTGLHFIKDHETIFSLSFKNIPGNHIEPGLGGVDIPSVGPKIHLGISQEF